MFVEIAVLRFLGGVKMENLNIDIDMSGYGSLSFEIYRTKMAKLFSEYLSCLGNLM